MRIFGREPEIEPIVSQFMQLIESYKKAADEQKQKIARENQEKTGKLTLVILTLRAEELVPDARNILTYRIAKWLDSSFEHASAMVGSKVLQVIPKEDVDFYLKLVKLTVESWLGRKNLMQFWSTLAGSDYHSARANTYSSEKQWESAVEEFLLASRYDEEFFPSYGGLVISLANVGLIRHFQERDYEATEYFERAVAAFEKLQPNALSYKKAKEGYELAKAMLT